MAGRGPAEHYSRMAWASPCDVPATNASLAPAPNSLTDEGAVTLEEVLETVSEFGEASRDLVAWEFALDGGELTGVWDQAVGEGLLRPVVKPGGTGEQMYALAAPGHVPARASAHCHLFD
jgi:hypothetical protein